MSLCPAVADYLYHSNVLFNLLEHPHSNSSLQTARVAHISPAQLAKAVVVRDHDRYLMCVLPSSNSLVLNWLNREFEGQFQLVEESELQKLFPLCEAGAVPPFGPAFDMPVCCERILEHARDVYLEAGDHRHVVHLNQENFATLMADASMSSFSCASKAMDVYLHIH